jgi:hypothetical protein
LGESHLELARKNGDSKVGDFSPIRGCVFKSNRTDIV